MGHEPLILVGMGDRWDFVISWLIVSASRSPPGLDPKRVHFWSSFSPGSEKGPLLELIFALGKLFGVTFNSFFDP